MKLYITGPPDGGEGPYDILTEDGEHLAGHYCSHRGYARGDLEANRPERQKEWRERFGEYEVVMLGDDDMNQDELIKRNHAWYERGDNRE